VRSDIVQARIRDEVRVSVVIPALNEAANLPHVFSSLPNWIDEVVLVDGKSIDNTVEVAKQLRPNIKVVLQSGTGKGDALLTGFSASIGDIIVMIDADGSTNGAEITCFVEALISGADLAKGSRFIPGGGSDDITRVRRWGNWMLSQIVNWIFNTSYTDLCYGYNAFWRRHLESLALDCTGFEVETLINIRAARIGLRVKEVPSYERSRVHGTSNLRVLSTGWRILRVILGEWHASRQASSRTHFTPESCQATALAGLATSESSRPLGVD
jgi:glycosyltransferase involved in cell wall biosynthesis